MKHKEKTIFEKEDVLSFLNKENISGFTLEALVLFLKQFVKTTKKNVFLEMESDSDAFDFYSAGVESDSSVFVYFPRGSSLDCVPGFEQEHLRYQKEALVRLINDRGLVCIGTTDSFNAPCVSKNIINNNVSLIFKTGEKLELDEFIKILVSLNYNKVEMVEEAGSFSQRGDVVDFFPEHKKNPFRVFFEFDLVETICCFDPKTQLPIQSLNKLVFADIKSSQNTDNISLRKHKMFKTPVKTRFNNGFFSLLFNKTNKQKELGFTTYFSPQKTTKEHRLELNLLLKNFTTVFFVAKTKKEIPFDIKKPVAFVFGSIERSFFSKKRLVFVLSENDFLGTYSQKNRWEPGRSNNYFDLSKNTISHLKIGDLVVHKSFGVGSYLGPIKRNSNIGVIEGVELEYKNNTRVFVSMEQLGLIHRYVGSGKQPGLSTLGSKKWDGEVKKTRSSVKEVAYEIFTLYSKKSQKRNFRYEKQNDIEGSLSNSFSFVETPDQKKAIADVYKDMNNEQPMDRLVCGDVGFGKTEVAIRAIFKACLSNKVSVLLCPTTILADQHYITCKERLSPFGVQVSLLSRFKSKKNQKETIGHLKTGGVDVLIGTHRILSKDVVVKNLGLLIVDEEHRFGVKDKEKIRSIKNNVDVLTLTATPIPRTLQQSLIGLRSLSTINTPPLSRKPILTFIKYFNWDLIFNRVKREVSRKGQVYFLNNDIKSIPAVVKKLKEKFKGFVVAGASGKLPSKELENVVLGFFEGKIDILVCTTIIESGLDVTNANTLIVNNAQNFGLSQLYQIRGRIGRGKRQAECLLLIPRGRDLDRESFNRLKAIEENTALGSGYNISQKDLEIRGGGSVFGYKQSGHISKIGFELYCDFLKEEINLVKGGGIEQDAPIIKLNTIIKISESYVKKDRLRIDYYYKLSKASTIKEICEIEKNLIDAFGPTPEETTLLVNSLKVKILLTGSLIKEINATNEGLSLSIGEQDGAFDIGLFFKKVESFKHKKLVNYKYEKSELYSLIISFKTTRFFPSMELLFSFIETIK